MAFKVPERYRIVNGKVATQSADGNNGFFMLRFGNEIARIIASDGLMWEHVSVSFATRCPTWAEMCIIKDTFWSDEDCVVQYHPPRSEYVNNHEYCLHLWRPVGVDLPLPPNLMVGIKSLGVLK